MNRFAILSLPCSRASTRQQRRFLIDLFFFSAEDNDATTIDYDKYLIEKIDLGNTVDNPDDSVVRISQKYAETHITKVTNTHCSNPLSVVMCFMKVMALI